MCGFREGYGLKINKPIELKMASLEVIMDFIMGNIGKTVLDS